MAEPDHRTRVGALLTLLASQEAQSSLACQIDRERVAYELARAWFDVVYRPSRRYLEGLKGDFSAESALAFEDAFDPVELAAMERFHRFFELRIEMLPEHHLKARRIPLDERWNAVMKDAGYLLEEFDLDASGRDLDLVSRLIRIGA